MSEYLPEVAWSTIASNVRLGLTSYRYLVDLFEFDTKEEMLKELIPYNYEYVE